MTLIKSLLLGSAAGIVAVATAQAADLPTRKAAPVEYVRVCNVGGITGWTLPGSDTCVKFSGYMTAHIIGGNVSSEYNSSELIATTAARARSIRSRPPVSLKSLWFKAAMFRRTVFNGAECSDHSAKRRCHRSGSVYPGDFYPQPEECDLQSQYDRLERSRQFRLRSRVEHRLRSVDWSL